MSAAGRARIAAAQRARWAKAKGQKVVSDCFQEHFAQLSARKLPFSFLSISLASGGR